MQLFYCLSEIIVAEVVIVSFMQNWRKRFIFCFCKTTAISDVNESRMKKENTMKNCIKLDSNKK